MAVRLEHANPLRRDMEVWVRFLRTTFPVSSARQV
jgi:hypothetical protein